MYQASSCVFEVVWQLTSKRAHVILGRPMTLAALHMQQQTRLTWIVAPLAQFELVDFESVCATTVDLLVVPEENTVEQSGPFPDDAKALEALKSQLAWHEVHTSRGFRDLFAQALYCWFPVAVPAVGPGKQVLASALVRLHSSRYYHSSM